MPYINGKRVNLPSSITTGKEIKKSIGENRSGRRVLVKRPSGNISVGENERVEISKKDKIQIVPDRVKANEFTYGGEKSDIQKKIIFSQVSDLEKKLFKNGIDIDEDFNWIMVRSFKLPDAWAEMNDSPFTKVLLIIPDQFPNLPTNGFYLPEDINAPSGDAHFFDSGYGGAYGETEEQTMEMSKQGWKWYCTHIPPENWKPARVRNIEDWRNGDNLWDVFNLIKDVLTDPYGD